MAVYKAFTSMEIGFNIAEIVPIIGVATGVLRTGLGTIQAIAGTAISITGLIGEAFSNERKWEDLRRAGGEQAIHGILNVARGVSAVAIGILAFMFTGGYGSLILLFPNIMHKDIFAPIFKYGTFERQEVV